MTIWEPPVNDYFQAFKLKLTSDKVQVKFVWQKSQFSDGASMWDMKDLLLVAFTLTSH